MNFLSKGKSSNFVDMCKTWCVDSVVDTMLLVSDASTGCCVKVCSMDLIIMGIHAKWYSLTYCTHVVSGFDGPVDILSLNTSIINIFLTEGKPLELQLDFEDLDNVTKSVAIWNCYSCFYIRFSNDAIHTKLQKVLDAFRLALFLNLLYKINLSVLIINHGKFVPLSCYTKLHSFLYSVFYSRHCYR